MLGSLLYEIDRPQSSNLLEFIHSSNALAPPGLRAFLSSRDRLETPGGIVLIDLTGPCTISSNHMLSVAVLMSALSQSNACNTLPSKRITRLPDYAG